MPRSSASRSLIMPLLVAFLIILALLPHRWLTWTNPLHHLLTALTAPVSDPLYSMAASLRRQPEIVPGLTGDPTEIRERFRQLTDQLRQKDNRIIALEYELQELEREIAALQGLQADLAGTSVAPLRAGVVGGNADPTARTLTINRGTRNGVREGLPVVDGASLVGRVIDAGVPTATVELITTPGRRFGAIVTPRELAAGGLSPERTAVCLFEVSGPRRLTATVSRDFPVAVGDYARLRDDDWPETVQGRIIGEVIAVDEHPAQPLLRNRILIAPIRPIDRLNRVTVIVPREFIATPTVPDDGAGAGGRR